MMILLPAYGRDYKSKKAVLAHFNSGYDFVCREYDKPDTLINQSQIPHGTQVNFRYSNMRKVFTHTVIRESVLRVIER